MTKKAEEDSIHYFFKCSAYSGFRIDFLSKLHECFESDAVPNENVLLNIIENGIYNIDNNIEKNINDSLFAAIKNFMKLTNRFNK